MQQHLIFFGDNTAKETLAPKLDISHLCQHCHVVAPDCLLGLKAVLNHAPSDRLPSQLFTLEDSPHANHNAAACMLCYDHARWDTLRQQLFCRIVAFTCTYMRRSCYYTCYFGIIVMGGVCIQVRRTIKASIRRSCSPQRVVSFPRLGIFVISAYGLQRVRNG